MSCLDRMTSCEGPPFSRRTTPAITAGATVVNTSDTAMRKMIKARPSVQHHATRAGYLRARGSISCFPGLQVVQSGRRFEAGSCACRFDLATEFLIALRQSLGHVRQGSVSSARRSVVKRSAPAAAAPPPYFNLANTATSGRCEGADVIFEYSQHHVNPSPRGLFPAAGDTVEYMERIGMRNQAPLTLGSSSVLG